MKLQFKWIPVAAVLAIVALAGEASIVIEPPADDYRVTPNRSMQEEQSLLIDDFSSRDGLSNLKTRWRMFTDRVMGGISSAHYTYEHIDGRSCLRLTGKVSLANNGGFIQVALPLEKKGRSLDAGIYTGVRLQVWGNGEDYHVHLRTRTTRMPWQFYQGSFSTVAGKWSMVEIPFDRFRGQGIRSPLETGRLTRIAVVAIKKEFQADIAISRLEFYRQAD